MNLPSLEMHEGTFAQFEKWWPLFEEHCPDLCEQCTPINEWGIGAGVTMDRWEQRLRRMRYETALKMDKVITLDGLLNLSGSE